MIAIIDDEDSTRITTKIIKTYTTKLLNKVVKQSNGDFDYIPRNRHERRKANKLHKDKIK